MEMRRVGYGHCENCGKYRVLFVEKGNVDWKGTLFRYCAECWKDGME